MIHRYRSVDEFGTAQLVEQIAAELGSIRARGRVFALSGPWGSGKTWIVEGVLPRLTDGAVSVVELDAWSFTDAGDLTSTLYQELGGQLNEWGRARVPIWRWRRWQHRTAQQSKAIRLHDAVPVGGTGYEALLEAAIWVWTRADQVPRELASKIQSKLVRYLKSTPVEEQREAIGVGTAMLIIGDRAVAELWARHGSAELLASILEQWWQEVGNGVFRDEQGRTAKLPVGPVQDWFGGAAVEMRDGLSRVGVSGTVVNEFVSILTEPPVSPTS